MRARILAIMAYAGAALTLLVAACVPFFLIGSFTNVVAHAGLHVDDAYTGGTVARTLDRGAYQILIFQSFRPHALQRVDPFIQIAFTPADRVPALIKEDIDADGDGQPDLRISFALPAGSATPVDGKVISLNSKYESVADFSSGSFSRLLVHAGDRIVVRIPLNRSTASQ